MKGQYQFWLDSLAWLAGPRTGPRPAIINEFAQAGFYRMKRGPSWVPVAVWPHGPDLGFKIGKEVVGADIGTEQWHWYAATTITEAESRKVGERGEHWSEAAPTVAAMQANGPTKPAPDATNPPADAT